VFSVCFELKERFGENRLKIENILSVLEFWNWTKINILIIEIMNSLNEVNLITDWFTNEVSLSIYNPHSRPSNSTRQ
jgi:hypothetical protein